MGRQIFESVSITESLILKCRESSGDTRDRVIATLYGAAKLSISDPKSMNAAVTKHIGPSKLISGKYETIEIHFPYPQTSIIAIVSCLTTKETRQPSSHFNPTVKIYEKGETKDAIPNPATHFVCNDIKVLESLADRELTDIFEDNILK